MSHEPEILFDQRGAAGLVLLNRPQALNAVTHGMVRALSQQLTVWAADPAIACVVVEGAGGRAFSVGGDIRHLYDCHARGRVEDAIAFWRDEYLLNAQIKAYPKPYVALVDGMVMGGGAGVSINASHCIAGERFQFAMPEVGIGFFPDIGATFFLPRLPGELGTWCALTGNRLGQADAAATGLVRAALPSAALGPLREALVAGEPADAAIERLATLPAPGPVAALRGIIDACFALDDVTTILAALDATALTGAAAAAEIAATIRAKSPTSLAIALRQMRVGRKLSFTEAMRTEFRIVCRLAYGHDFYEGIRAVIIDKDNAPRWRPASLDEIAPAEIDRHFAPLDRELPL